MPMDGITIGAVCNELSALLSNGKIDKIQQPESDILLITVRSGGRNHRLLLCAGSHPRMHITTMQYDNPAVAPAFCMLLRKHLTGGRIQGITQYGNERVVFIDILSANELGDLTKKSLVVEIMGKYSNIIFINSENIVLDAIKHVNQEISRLRQVMPHDMYELPPPQDKQQPVLEDIEQFVQAFPAPTAKQIMNGFVGISTQAAQEIAYLMQTHGQSGFAQYMDKVQNKQYKPYMLVNEHHEPVDFLPFAYTELLEERLMEYPSFSQLIEGFYGQKDSLVRTRARSKELHDLLALLAERARKKQGIYQQKLLECKDMDKYQIYGELLTANLYACKRGQKSISVQNYYSENAEMLEIPLDVRISPQANAQKFFKQYRKLKTASRLLDAQIGENDQELAYLESLLTSLDNCQSTADIEEIRQELVEQGYLRAKAKPQKVQPSAPLRFVAPDGTEILVGRNNKQNDLLTLRIAQPDELWLHVKGIAGSHVIVRSQSPCEQTLNLALQLAAYHSKARNSANVAVDATQVKNVKKPRKAKPGMVIYETYSTYYTTPEEQFIKRFSQNEKADVTSTR